jgi:hypothetical protein
MRWRKSIGSMIQVLLNKIMIFGFELVAAWQHEAKEGRSKSTHDAAGMATET